MSADEIALKECGRLNVGDFSHAQLVLQAMLRTALYTGYSNWGGYLRCVAVLTADPVATGEVKCHN